MEIAVMTIPLAWASAVRAVIKNGTQHETGSQVTIEMDEPLLSRIRTPMEDRISKFSKYNKTTLDDYSRKVIQGTPTGHDYDYGSRLRFHGTSGVDQIQCIINTLNNDRSTRKASFVLWDSTVDSLAGSIPCWISGSFKIRNSLLDLTVTFRSHDIFGAYPANLYMLTELLNYVSKSTISKPGKLAVLSVIPHIYLTDYHEAQALIGGIA